MRSAEGERRGGGLGRGGRFTGRGRCDRRLLLLLLLPVLVLVLVLVLKLVLVWVEKLYYVRGACARGRRKEKLLLLLLAIRR